MTTLNVFKFSIGEVVQFKSAPHHTYLVIEQHLQICSGGQQVKYLVRGFKKERFIGSGVSDNYNLFNEIELEAVEEEAPVRKKEEEKVPTEEKGIAGDPSDP
ncbi:hypothetical protein ES703_60583 [subsurface metagenome]